MKMIKYLLVFFLLSVIPSYNLTAQDKTDHGKKSESRSGNEEIDEKEKEHVVHWNFGINIGGYYANKYPAEFYNGAAYNINNVNYVMSNYYWYQDIKHALGASDTVVVTEDDYPMNMHYKFAMMGGLFIRYNFNFNWGLCLDVNYTQLKAEDAVTFEVDPQSYLTYPDIRYIPIRGVEQRVHLNLMLQRNFRLQSRIYFFVQGGLNLNYVRVLQSSIYVEDREYNLINIYGSQYYVPGLSLQEYTVIQGGVGYGFMAAGGAGIPLTDMFGIEPGVFFNYNNVNLEGYNQFKPSFGINLRLLFGNILPIPDDE
jgi:hypothetical protein